MEVEDEDDEEADAQVLTHRKDSLKDDSEQEIIPVNRFDSSQQENMSQDNPMKVVLNER